MKKLCMHIGRGPVLLLISNLPLARRSYQRQALDISMGYETGSMCQQESEDVIHLMFSDD